MREINNYKWSRFWNKADSLNQIDMKKSRWFWLLAAVVLLIASSIFGINQESNETVVETDVNIEESEDIELVPIMDMVIEHGTLNTLAKLLVKSGISREMIEEEGPYTLFAPDDSAFAVLSKEEIKRFDSDPEYFKNVMARHIVKGQAIMFEDSNQLTLVTLRGERITILVSEEEVRVGTASIIEEEINCSNGIIHVIDAVLLSNKEKEEE
jgi:uncharacterized surface protein with fasciclin (FAS1) repeats